MNAKPSDITSTDAPLDPQGWADALRLHERWLRTVVAARLGDRQAVDEVLQEVSLAVVSSRATVDASYAAAWLYRLAVRKVLMHRRAAGRRRRRDVRYAARFQMLQGTDPDSGAQDLDPLGWLLLDERSALIRRALASLRPRDAEILLLKYTEGWSYRDLASHLGQTEAAIESRLHRARCRLRQKLIASNVIEVES